MIVFGVILLVLGGVLVVAESHMPSGALGITGGAALVVGGVVAIGALGGSASVAIAVAAGLGIAAAGWTLVVVRHAADSTQAPPQSGAEALAGRIGVVRTWIDSDGQVLVDGAIWRARHQPMVGGGGGALSPGDQIVVERVNGLTLNVRRAEEWELVR